MITDVLQKIQPLEMRDGMCIYRLRGELSLVDRFLMVEDWAQAAKSMVVVAMVTHSRYIHPRKFGVTVAAHLGLTCDVFTSRDAASKWLQGAEVSAGRASG